MSRGPPQQSPFGGHDPFAAMGFPSVRSLFDDTFFARDPFDDPFFTQPFGGSLFGRPLHSPGLTPFQIPALAPLAPPPFFGAGPRASNPAPQPPAARLSVQEVDPESDHGHFPSSHEPIVEHPESEDEEEEPLGRQRQHERGQGSHGRQYERQGAQQQQQTIVTSAHPFPGLSSVFGDFGQGASGFTYQSSYVSHSGINGAQYYTASSSRSVGPGGVVEEQHSQRDSSGHESMTIARGINEKGRTVTRARRGRDEHSSEILHNITPEEARDFDQRWQQQAFGGIGGSPFGDSQRGAASALPAPEPQDGQPPRTRRRSFWS